MARWTFFCGVVVASGAFAEEPEKDAQGWSGDLALSVTAQTGSVDTFAGSIDARTARKWTKDIASIRFTGVYGTSRDRNGNDSSDETVQDSQVLLSEWKRVLDDRFFWVSNSELSRDSTQDREVRARLSTGPGYRVWRREDEPDRRHLDLSVGIGYRYELYDGNTGPSTNPDTLGSLVADNGSDQHLADIIAGFEYKNLYFEDRIEWTHTFTAAMPANKPSAYIIRTEGIVGIPLTEAWSFRTGVLYEYVNDVPDDVNPSTMRVTVGLGYQF